MEKKKSVGRPHKWGEPGRLITVPVRAVPEIQEFIEKWVKENGPDKSNGA